MATKNCPTHKKAMDKKSAISLKNLTMRLHHIEMKEYECKQCGWWHLATKGNNHKRFRHNLVTGY
jgi:hypothetical protein